MTPVVQQWLAYVAVLGAAAWLLRRWTRHRAARTCDRCRATSPSAGTSMRPRGRGIRHPLLRVLR